MWTTIDIRITQLQDSSGQYYWRAETFGEYDHGTITSWVFVAANDSYSRSQCIQDLHAFHAARSALSRSLMAPQDHHLLLREISASQHLIDHWFHIKVGMNHQGGNLIITTDHASLNNSWLPLLSLSTKVQASALPADPSLNGAPPPPPVPLTPGYPELDQNKAEPVDLLSIIPTF